MTPEEPSVGYYAIEVLVTAGTCVGLAALTSNSLTLGLWSALGLISGRALYRARVHYRERR